MSVSNWAASCKPRLSILIPQDWESPDPKTIRQTPLRASRHWAGWEGGRAPGNLLCPGTHPAQAATLPLPTPTPRGSPAGTLLSRPKSILILSTLLPQPWGFSEQLGRTLPWASPAPTAVPGTPKDQVPVPPPPPHGRTLPHGSIPSTSTFHPKPKQPTEVKFVGGWVGAACVPLCAVPHAAQPTSAALDEASGHLHISNLIVALAPATAFSFRGCSWSPPVGLFPCGLPVLAHAWSSVHFAENGGRGSPNPSVREDLWARRPRNPLAPPVGGAGWRWHLGHSPHAVGCPGRGFFSLHSTLGGGAPVARSRGPEGGERCCLSPGLWPAVPAPLPAPGPLSLGSLHLAPQTSASSRQTPDPTLAGQWACLPLGPAMSQARKSGPEVRPGRVSLRPPQRQPAVEAGHC